jgi:hypothetical protein
MAARISRVAVDRAALQKIFPLVPAAFFDAAINHTDTRGVNALYDYLRSLLGQQINPLSSLLARPAYMALRNLIPRQRFGLPGDRLPDVDRERALIVRTAGQYIAELFAGAAPVVPAPAPAPPPPPPPPPPPSDDDDGDNDGDDDGDGNGTPMWMIDPRLRYLAGRCPCHPG